MTKREDWIDACKGIGIICVVAGHVLMQTELSREIARVIFLFHMPLFFMISGYTFKPEARSSFVRKRMYALLLPYLSFMLLLDALTLLRTTAIEGMPSLAVLASLLARNILGGRYLGSDFGVFWFVTCLFIALLVFNEIELRYQATPRRALLAVTACFAASIPVAAFPAVNAAPWSLANVPLAICFLWAGKTARRTDRRLLASAAAGVITIAAAASYGGLEFVFDMKKVLYGPPILGVLLAASLSVIIMLAMQLLKEQNRLIQPLKALGSASLVIMFLHQLIHCCWNLVTTRSRF
jgi:fucose 4-O-acetylase-like acetyltransferase